MSKGSLEGQGHQLGAPPEITRRRRSSVYSDGNKGKLAQRRSSLFQTSGANLKFRKSITGSESSHGNKKPQMENTYQLEPKEDELFVSYKVEQVITNVLKMNIGDRQYSKADTPGLTKLLATLIKQEVKDMGFTRHKIVVNVMLGSNKDQGVQAASRCVWNDKTDSFTSGSYKNEHLFCVAMVHAVYFD